MSFWTESDVQVNDSEAKDDVHHLIVHFLVLSLGLHAANEVHASRFLVHSFQC